ncbi:MAG: hypothetical protein WA786_00285 [Acidimicrobiales bacterium]
MPAGLDESRPGGGVGDAGDGQSSRVLEGLDREGRAFAVVTRGVDERRVAEVGQPFLELQYSGT